MNLTPREKDKLLISLAAMVARGRLQRPATGASQFPTRKWG